MVCVCSMYYEGEFLYYYYFYFNIMCRCTDKVIERERERETKPKNPKTKIKSESSEQKKRKNRILNLFFFLMPFWSLFLVGLFFFFSSTSPFFLRFTPFYLPRLCLPPLYIKIEPIRCVCGVSVNGLRFLYFEDVMNNNNNNKLLCVLFIKGRCVCPFFCC